MNWVDMPPEVGDGDDDDEGMMMMMMNPYRPTVSTMSGKGNELYFLPQHNVGIDEKRAEVGKPLCIAIMARNQMLCPEGEEYFHVTEMRYRQLINDDGENGLIGYSYFSVENGKLALVGTLARIKRIERLVNGEMYVLLKGVGRYYIKDVYQQLPYPCAEVQKFVDYTENDISYLNTLECELLQEVRYSVKLMKFLYPNNSYKINEAVLRYRPWLVNHDARTVHLPRLEKEIRRISKFTFACMDMIRTDNVNKLLFLQTHVLEERLKAMVKKLKESTTFIAGEIIKRQIVSADKMHTISREALLNDTSDMNTIPLTSWKPDNYINGQWKMLPQPMD
jgi:ATP-dependent Lon protease